MSQCEHRQFKAVVCVNRLQISETDQRIGGYSADIRIECADCQLPFEFVGIPCGYLHDRPAASWNFQELRTPIIPRGERLPEMQRLGFLVKPPTKNRGGAHGPTIQAAQ